QEYNEKNGITPTALNKSTDTLLPGAKPTLINPYVQVGGANMAADTQAVYHSKQDMQKDIEKIRKKMENAAKALDFIEAARLRDELGAMEERMKKEFARSEQHTSELQSRENL